MVSRPYSLPQYLKAALAGVLTLALGTSCAVPSQTVAPSAGRASPTATVGTQPRVTTTAPAAGGTMAPVAQDSVRFAVIGDTGTGERAQYDVGAQLTKSREVFPFEFVIMMGDNMYGSERPQDYVRKFELPYKQILDAKVLFYASLGNHDGVEQRLYPQFNMDGKRYYSFKAPKQDVRFFALESTYLTTEQIGWFETELRGSNEDWKIAFFHHPPYSSGEKHGSHAPIREALEPLFIKYNVSVVLTGHDHFYERIKPQNGIAYFVVGSGGKLRRGNIDARSPLTAKGFDTDLAFLAAEIDGDEMFFNTVSRAGKVVDSGTIARRK